jgi:transposase
MSDVKFIGLDVHKTSISAAVLDESGKLAMQSVVATQAAAILDLIHGIRGTLHVTFEEGTHSAWLYDLLRPRVAKVVVSNPRKNALLNSGNKSDQIDARKLAELLRLQRLSPVYHGHNSTVTLKELCRSYAALTEDTTRVMSRIKAVYRGQAIVHAGKTIYSKRRRQQWLEQLAQPGLRRRAERLYQQLDVLQSLRRQARVDLIREGRQHDASRILSSIPFLGPIRSAVLIGRMQTPHRFRTKRQLWTYCGMALETRSSRQGKSPGLAAEYQGYLWNIQSVRNCKEMQPSYSMSMILDAYWTLSVQMKRCGQSGSDLNSRAQRGHTPHKKTSTMTRCIAALGNLAAASCRANTSSSPVPFCRSPKLSPFGTARNRLADTALPERHGRESRISRAPGLQICALHLTEFV